ncbi:unnamed protein product [Blepharisma stoltei]|uniref:Uncharacterized protein n=1 Tax=Blepharisma stoltei TaxID=1481888 RepID=A0AAU9JX03_9CILI|nr:unnamed protein product [Blepharisma stoltei]
MRPTLLGFRSPKEQTPDPYYTTVTYEGRSLSFSPPKGDIKRTSFSKEKRFGVYSQNAKKLGYLLGPGTHSPENLTIGKEKIAGGHLYKGFHGGKSNKNEGYFMVGNHLVFSAHYMTPSKRHSVTDMDCKLDSSYYTNSRSRRPFSSMSSERTTTSDQRNVSTASSGYRRKLISSLKKDLFGVKPQKTRKNHSELIGDKKEKKLKKYNSSSTKYRKLVRKLLSSRYDRSFC